MSKSSKSAQQHLAIAKSAKAQAPLHSSILFPALKSRVQGVNLTGLFIVTLYCKGEKRDEW
jgi:hypothetical protein